MQRPASTFHCPRVNPCEEVSNSAAETGSTGWTIFLTSHHCHTLPRNLNLGWLYCRCCSICCQVAPNPDATDLSSVIAPCVCQQGRSASNHGGFRSFLADVLFGDDEDEATYWEPGCLSLSAGEWFVLNCDPVAWRIKFCHAFCMRRPCWFVPCFACA